MSRASEAANSLVYAAEQVCALYGVQFTREQSRMINVEGAAGRWRPMVFGAWTDNFGKIHRAGKADLLARPRIVIGEAGTWEYFISAPLWIECKTGKGRLTPDQIAFKNWVESNGDAYLLLHDDVRPLMAWFEAHGVEKREANLNAVQSKVAATDLYLLPCKHCGKPRSEHIGAAFGCAGKTRRVWTPDIGAAR